MKIGKAEDIGTREHYEDWSASFKIAVIIAGELYEYLVAILCDGMGGLKAGEVASQRAGQVCAASIFQGITQATVKPDVAFVVEHAIKCANTNLFRNFAGESASTIVAAVIEGNQVTVGHLGDSRCHIIGSDGLWKVTRDHSYVNDLLDAGLINEEQARNHHAKNIITKAVGLAEIAAPDVNTFTIQSGDIVMLSCDGTSVCPDKEVFDLVRKSSCESIADIQKTAEKIVNTALSKPECEDNLTVILIAPDVPKSISTTTKSYADLAANAKAIKSLSRNTKTSRMVAKVVIDRK